MITAIEESPLYPIVNPKSIAFFGASNNFTRMGSIMLSSVEALGYEGAVYPIHLTEEQVRGHKAYKSRPGHYRSAHGCCLSDYGSMR